MWKRGEIAPQEQFLLFSSLFYISISYFRSQITYSFAKWVVQFIVFLTLSTLICRSTDISKCFSESLGIRDNESRLYTADISKYFPPPPRKTRFDISCKLSTMETNCKHCRFLFSGKNKKNIANLSSAVAQRVVKVKWIISTVDAV